MVQTPSTPGMKCSLFLSTSFRSFTSDQAKYRCVRKKGILKYDRMYILSDTFKNLTWLDIQQIPVCSWQVLFPWLLCYENFIFNFYSSSSSKKIELLLIVIDHCHCVFLDRLGSFSTVRRWCMNSNWVTTSPLRKWWKERAVSTSGVVRRPTQHLASMKHGMASPFVRMSSNYFTSQLL